MLKKILKLLPWSFGGSIVGLLFANFVIGTVEPQGTTAPGKAVSQGTIAHGEPLTVDQSNSGAVRFGTTTGLIYQSEDERIRAACDQYYKMALTEQESMSGQRMDTDMVMAHSSLMQAYTQLYMACRERAK